MAARRNLDAHEDGRIGGIGVAVIELGDATLVQSVDERLEGPRFLRDGHRQDGLALFTDFRALRDIAQAIEVHVGPTEGGHQVFILDLFALDVLLDTSHAERTGRFGDGAGVFKDILDGGADFVGGDGDHLIHIVLADLPGILADLLDGHAIREDAHFVQYHPLASLHGRLQAVGVLGFNADHLDFRAQVFDVGRHASNQSAAANTDKDGMNGFAELPHDFHGHSALPGDDVRVVIGRDVGVAVLRDQLLSMSCGLVKSVALENHFGAVITHRSHFDLWRGLRHDDDRLDTQVLGSQGHALGMVASRGTNHALGFLLFRELRNPVVGATNLERKHRLKVFALEQNVVAKAL